MTDIDKDLITEIEERRRAELEIIESAYDPSEVWIIPSLEDDDNDNDEFPLASCSPEIHRRLTFENDSLELELILTMPHQNQYPVLETSILSVDAQILKVEEPNNFDDDQKLRNHLISNLIQTCRQTSEENPGCESVFTVLSKADEWIQEEGQTLLMHSISSTQQQEKETTKAATAKQPPHTATNCKKHPPTAHSAQHPQQLFLHVLSSHHLLNHAPDNLLAKGGTKYKLNGYYRFGTPGLALCVSSTTQDVDDPHIQNFVEALEKKMPQKKFDIVLSRPLLYNGDDTTHNASSVNGWKEATMDQLRSILTNDEFRDILNIQGGGGGDSSATTNSAAKSGKKNHETQKKKKTKNKKINK